MLDKQVFDFAVTDSGVIIKQSCCRMFLIVDEWTFAVAVGREPFIVDQ